MHYFNSLSNASYPISSSLDKAAFCFKLVALKIFSGNWLSVKGLFLSSNFHGTSCNLVIHTEFCFVCQRGHFDSVENKNALEVTYIESFHLRY